MLHYNAYTIKKISHEDYLSACSQLEHLIFGDYFAFDWEALRRERGTTSQQKKSTPVDRLCWGVFFEDKIVGWHYSQQSADGELLMKDTGLLPEHQGKGIYSFLLPEIIKEAGSLGYEQIISHHRMTNNRVIVPKLKAGFLINGIRTDQYGMAVQLIFSLVPEYVECLKVRSGERRPIGKVAKLLGL